MGPQDGVDIALRAADVVVHELRRDDIAFTLIGSGDCFDDLVALRDELGLADDVEFTGRVPDELVTRILSTADVGLSPDKLRAFAPHPGRTRLAWQIPFRKPLPEDRQSIRRPRVVYG